MTNCIIIMLKLWNHPTNEIYSDFSKYANPSSIHAIYTFAMNLGLTNMLLLSVSATAVIGQAGSM